MATRHQHRRGEIQLNMVTGNITIMWTLEHLQTRADGVCRGEVSVKMLPCIAQYAGVHGEGFSWSPVRQCTVSTMTILPGPDCLRHLPGVPHSDILDSRVIVMLPSSLALLFKQQHLLLLIQFYPCLCSPLLHATITIPPLC